MEGVTLEWISSVEVEPQDVVQFVQQLNNVPDNAVCEVGEIFSRWHRTSSQSRGNQSQRRIRNEVHLSCEPRVAEFVCKKFGKQTRYVTGSEVILIRCKRVFPGVKPLGAEQDASARVPEKETEDDTIRKVHSRADVNSSEAPVLPIEKVIALIDLLGDQVVDAQEAYEFFADADARAPQRMAMLGLTKALGKLSKKEWTAKPTRRRAAYSLESGSTVKVTVESLRYLLSKLIASDNVAVRRIPSATTVPFLSYTDFLACYVAFLATLHSSA
ncbi:hypothetical protein KRP22_007793 [Phytophthora ramorum]|nr:hypothetical protein KRP22_4195 [Phytophthora ramorum]